MHNDEDLVKQDEDKEPEVRYSKLRQLMHRYEATMERKVLDKVVGEMQQNRDLVLARSALDLSNLDRFVQKQKQLRLMIDNDQTPANKEHCQQELGRLEESIEQCLK